MKEGRCGLGWNESIQKKIHEPNGTNTRLYHTENDLVVIDNDSKKLPPELVSLMGNIEPTTVTKRGAHYYFMHDGTVTYINRTHLTSSKKIDVRGAGGILYFQYDGDNPNISYTHNPDNIYKLDDFPMVKLWLNEVAVAKHKTKKETHTNEEMSLNEVQKLINMVDILDYSDRDKWMGILASLYAANPNSEDIARKWSQGDVEAYDDKSFDDVWRQLENGKYGSSHTKGTLIKAAHGEGVKFKTEAGSVEPTPTPAPKNEMGVITPTKRTRGEVPPRPIIYKGHFIKGFVTATAAAGGTGKTSLLDIETISLALGFDLFREDRNPSLYGQAKVLVISLEDDQNEFNRRYTAIERYYGLSNEELGLIDKNITTLFAINRIVELAGGIPIRQEQVIIALKALILDIGADVVTIDPFISIHAVSENSNEQMQIVLEVLREIARDCNCNIHLLQHTRKGLTTEDSARGASAIRDGVRYQRMLSRLDSKTMDMMGIPKKDQPYIIHSFNGKANHEPRGDDILLYKTESVTLGNGTKEYKGDTIGVVAAYNIKDVLELVSTSEVQTIWDAINNAPPENRRASKQSGSDWIGTIIKENLPNNFDETQKQLIAEKAVKLWKNNGTLISEKWKDIDSKVRPILTYNGED